MTPSSRERFFDFITSDGRRDFEGLGGWRTPLPRKRNGTASVSSSSSVNLSSEGELDEDDQAWLSINKRLELPSSSRQFPAFLTSPTNTMNDYGLTPERRFEMEQPPPPPPPPQQRRPGYHKRSITTSSLVLHMGSSSTSGGDIEGGEQTHAGPIAMSSPWTLRPSKSTVGLESLPSTSTTPNSRPPSHHGVLEQPFLMTTTTPFHGRYHSVGGRSLAMAHYYPVNSVGLQRRRRSSSSSAAATGGTKYPAFST